MNIPSEQDAAPVAQPNRSARRRLPRPLADVRRRTAQAMLRPADEPRTTRTVTPPPPRPLALAARRGTSVLALAAAALAVPTLPGTASATTARISGDTAAIAAAPAGTLAPPVPYARHHIPHELLIPASGAVSFQAWAASGWTLAMPDTEVNPRCLDFPHHHRCIPWGYPAGPKFVASPETGAARNDGQPALAAFRIPHLDPRNLGDPEIPESRLPSPGADTSTSSGTSATAGDSMSDFPRPGSTTDQRTDDPATAPAARARPFTTTARMPATALTPATATTATSAPTTSAAATSAATTSATTAKVTANAPASATSVTKAPVTKAPLTKTQPAKAPATTGSAPSPASRTNRFATAAKNPLSSPCLRAAYFAGKDHRMLAHLRPAADAMGVIIGHRRAACAAMVDYLSQARA